MFQYSDIFKGIYFCNVLFVETEHLHSNCMFIISLLIALFSGFLYNDAFAKDQSFLRDRTLQAVAVFNAYITSEKNCSENVLVKQNIGAEHQLQQCKLYAVLAGSLFLLTFFLLSKFFCNCITLPNVHRWFCITMLRIDNWGRHINNMTASCKTRRSSDWPHNHRLTAIRRPSILIDVMRVMIVIKCPIVDLKHQSGAQKMIVSTTIKCQTFHRCHIEKPECDFKAILLVLVVSWGRNGNLAFAETHSDLR